MDSSNSRKLHAQALQLMPGGVNSPVRSFYAVNSTPRYIKSGLGSKITDHDGNEYIDFVCGWGSNILGHSNSKVLNAISNEIKNGLGFGAPSAAEIALAKLVKENYPAMEQMRFTNSGTEAVQGALRLARAVTGKNKIIKFIGCYHGHADQLLVKAGSGLATFSAPDSEGIPASFVSETICVEYNKIEDLAEVIGSSSNELAAVIIEPIAGNMGMVMPEPNILLQLRGLCDQHKVLLIFDEVMTGYRTALGGCSSLFSIVPDITILGKIIGGGLPVGCFGSSYSNMAHLSPLGKVYQGGTFCGNPVVMAAGAVVLQELQGADIYYDLSEYSTNLCVELASIAKRIGVPFCSSNLGGMFGYFFLNDKPKNFAQVNRLDQKFYGAYFSKMLSRGIYLAPSAFEASFITTAHSEEDFEKFISAFAESLLELLDEKTLPKNV